MAAIVTSEEFPKTCDNYLNIYVLIRIKLKVQYVRMIMLSSEHEDKTVLTLGQICLCIMLQRYLLKWHANQLALRLKTSV